SGCLFHGNQALGGDGGAMLVEGPASISGCQFVDNSAAGSDGGAVAISLGQGLSIQDCLFVGNSATTTPPIGPGAFVYGGCGGAVALQVGSVLEVYDPGAQTQLVGNGALFGGALCVTDISWVFVSNDAYVNLRANRALASGGAVAMQNGVLNFYAATIAIV